MDIRKLQRAIVDGLEDVKAQDIRVFNTEHLSPLFERVIIASGTSNRQTKALGLERARRGASRAACPCCATEGEDNGEWIIVDCGAAVAHIMQPAIRDYYHLEEIWGDKPVRMKIDGTAPAPAAAPGRVDPAHGAAPQRPLRRSGLRRRSGRGGEAACGEAAARSAEDSRQGQDARRMTPTSRAMRVNGGIRCAACGCWSSRSASACRPGRKPRSTTSPSASRPNGGSSSRP